MRASGRQSLYIAAAKEPLADVLEERKSSKAIRQALCNPNLKKKEKKKKKLKESGFIYDEG